MVHTGRSTECAPSTTNSPLTFRSMSGINAARSSLYRVLVAEGAPSMMSFARSFASDINQADKARNDSNASASSSSSSGGDLPGWLKGPQLRQKAPLAEEWIETSDPKSGETFWRSSVTGDCTRPGISKPHSWHQVVDKSSGLLYYWNPATGETTTVGEPRPGPYGRHAAFSLAEHEAASTGASGSSKKGDKEEPELSLFSLYNNPLGYLLLGMAVFGIISQNMPKWS